MKAIMKTPLLLLALFSLLLAPAACALAGGTTGCDFREDSVNGPEPRCQERSGLQGGTTFSTTCSALKGKAIDDGCPRAGIVSGCDISDDGTVIDWYYAPTTVEEVAKQCADDKGKVVSP